MGAEVGRTLVVVLAHPDDDTFGVGGSIALHAEDPDLRFVLVLATSGDAGEISDPALATRENLAAVREEEDRSSWRALGREPDRLEFLRFKDGTLATMDRETLIRSVAAILEEEQPDLVITFGPEGVTAHVDHISIGRATMEAFHQVRLAGPGAFRRLLQICIPESLLAVFNERLIAAGEEPIDPTKPFQPRGVPDQMVAVEVDTSSVWRRTLAALKEHRTQSETGMPEEMAEQVLSAEFFSQPFPGRPPGAPRLTDIFEGL
ncbi:MAG: N-acetylglucosamine malate deacetylase 2 [Actinomycetota bacterium]|nr:N-acetylglucosamine malate deacetylase 2 [Actinomycetota bacterium]